MKSEGDIFIVCDEIADLRLLTGLLEKEGYRVRPAEMAQMAIDSALTRPPTLILLDVRMPGTDGFEVCRRLKGDKRTQDIPIIFISSLDAAEDRVRGFEAGGVDFISRPFQEQEVLARVGTQTRLHRMQQRLEQLVAERTAELTAEVNERKKAMDALRESEKRFRALMEQSPTPFTILSPAGKLERVNSAWRQLWAVNEEQTAAIMENYNLLTDQQMADLGMAPLIKKAFEGESVVLPPIRYSGGRTVEDIGLTFRDIATPWIQTHLYPVKDETGKVEFMVNTNMEITEQKEAADQIQAYQERLRALAAELTISEERERRRIATELHDGAAQSLAFARLQLTAVQKAVPDEKSAARVGEVSQSLKESLQQIRDVLLDLSSPALNEIGLAAALSEWLEEQVGRRRGLGTSFVDECGVVPLDDVVRALLFRNARELIMNAVKHAEAKMVSVHLAVSDQVLRITVADDGRGFEPDASIHKPNNEGGFGLFSIRERMADLGGTLEIESAPGKGCKATLVVPLRDDTG